MIRSASRRVRSACAEQREGYIPPIIIFEDGKTCLAASNASFTPRYQYVMMEVIRIMSGSLLSPSFLMRASLEMPYRLKRFRMCLSAGGLSTFSFTKGALPSTFRFLSTICIQSMRLTSISFARSIPPM